MQLSGTLQYFNDECLLRVQTADPFHPIREIHLAVNPAFNPMGPANVLAAAFKFFQNHNVANNAPITISGDYGTVAGNVTAFYVSSMP
jgi:hypothetical protein